MSVCTVVITRGKRKGQACGARAPHGCNNRSRNHSKPPKTRSAPLVKSNPPLHPAVTNQMTNYFYDLPPELQETIQTQADELYYWAIDKWGEKHMNNRDFKVGQFHGTRSGYVDACYEVTQVKTSLNSLKSEKVVFKAKCGYIFERKVDWDTEYDSEMQVTFSECDAKIYSKGIKAGSFPNIKYLPVRYVIDTLESNENLICGVSFQDNGGDVSVFYDDSECQCEACTWPALEKVIRSYANDNSIS